MAFFAFLFLHHVSKYFHPLTFLFPPFLIPICGSCIPSPSIFLHFTFSPRHTLSASSKPSSSSLLSLLRTSVAFITCLHRLYLQQHIYANIPCVKVLCCKMLERKANRILSNATVRTYWLPFSVMFYSEVSFRSKGVTFSLKNVLHII